MTTPSQTQIGRYEILERIGIGGMGEVFRCRTSGVEGFQKEVVLKVVLPEMQGEPEFERAFVDEAKLSVQLQHPNIVQTFDLGKHEQRLYLVMEYVDGHDFGFVLRTLRRKEEKVPMPVAVYAAIELLRGLDHAHKAKAPDGTPLDIIHRDVTPGNVMAGFNGSVKLADFGIARFSSRTQQKTTTGFVKGKVAYMPPEQVEGRALVPATDVFSAALVLSTMLFGHHPLEHCSEAQLMDRIRAGDIPLPGAHRTLDKILGKALAPRLEDRTPTAQAFLEQLESFVLDNHVRTGPQVLSSWMLDLFHDELAKRARDKGHAELVTTDIPPTVEKPSAKDQIASPKPVAPAPIDTSIPATRPEPARVSPPAAPARRGRRMLVIAPVVLALAGGVAGVGWLAREPVRRAQIRKECIGEWRVLSQQPVKGEIPGDPLVKGVDLRLSVVESAENGLRIQFKRGSDAALTVPLDLEREGATLIGRYNDVPLKFWFGDATALTKAERMNLRVRFRPAGSVLTLELLAFGEGFPEREWTVTATK